MPRWCVSQADLLLQVFVFALQPLAQLLDLGQRLAQAFSRSRAAGVMSRNTMTAPMSTAAVADRRRGVLDAEGYAVLAPEHLAVDLVHGAVAEGGIDRAFVVGIVAAVGMACGGPSGACPGRRSRPPSSPACARPPG